MASIQGSCCIFHKKVAGCKLGDLFISKRELLYHQLHICKLCKCTKSKYSLLTDRINCSNVRLFIICSSIKVWTIFCYYFSKSKVRLTKVFHCFVLCLSNIGKRYAIPFVLGNIFRVNTSERVKANW